MVDHPVGANGTRERIKVEDLEATVGYPVGRYQPNGLPHLKANSLTDEAIASLQRPAAMLDF